MSRLQQHDVANRPSPLTGEYVAGTLSHTNRICTRTTPDVTFVRARGGNRFASDDGTIFSRGRWRWTRTTGPGLARSFRYRGRIDYFKKGEGRIDSVVIEAGFKYDEEGRLIYSYP